MDVFTFLALDFGLRTVTVLTPPGSTGLQSALICLWSLISPAYGVRRALLAIGFPETEMGDSELEESLKKAWLRLTARFTGGKRSELEMALRSGTLCMLVPSSVRIGSSLKPESAFPVSRKTTPKSLSNPKTSQLEALPLEPINTLMTSVHGQYPSDIRPLYGPWNQPVDDEAGEEFASPAEYSLVKVPSSFSVFSIIAEGEPESLTQAIRQWVSNKGSPSAGVPGDSQKAVPLRLSSNERVVKAICTIFQILYGSYEIYRMGGDHLRKYGYAAYEFTIIPYLTMSLMNLLVSCVRPTYPSMYIVHYRGKVPPGTMTKEGKKPTDTGLSYTSLYDNQRMTIDADQVKPVLSPSKAVPVDMTEDRNGNQNSDYPKYWWSPSDCLELERNVSGAIGYVYGDFTRKKDLREIKRHHFFDIHTWKNRFLENPIFTPFVLTIYILLYYTAPYILIQILTGFDRGNSTPLQRGFIIMWIASG
ncbi:uncharacterized protein LAJ45_11201 [Morchella importuna]|uniref:uncharacterized protein n=1 Tax=Morchella importuna TaxID=1174673 RepID=UPI001E8E1AD1|nr:uncharacterized protein LAJ45_11220 [Morchella importuna]XP_045966109.1 uncharacterized protein LAJ45_11201 [Morchella importuna]KAH8144785.1 hypothetical protein LAJ45_11220 [Morchella importuna]KAH8144805.1 hypothetical protein LAJ45_11201 [Morchella importuna]